MGLVSGILTESVYLASVSSVDGRGRATYGKPRKTPARVERIDLTAIAGPGGEDAQVDTVVFLELEPLISDRIWLPGESHLDATKARRIMRVERATTLDGQTSHFRAFI